MHLNDTGPDLREVIASKEEEETERRQCDHQGNFHEGATTVDDPFEQRAVALAELVEAPLEAFLKEEKGVPRRFSGGLFVRFMRLRHGDSSSYISPWSARACVTE